MINHVHNLFKVYYKQKLASKGNQTIANLLLLAKENFPQGSATLGSSF